MIAAAAAIKNLRRNILNSWGHKNGPISVLGSLRRVLLTCFPAIFLPGFGHESLLAFNQQKRAICAYEPLAWQLWGRCSNVWDHSQRSICGCFQRDAARLVGSIACADHRARAPDDLGPTRAGRILASQSRDHRIGSRDPVVRESIELPQGDRPAG